jgi:hypothetical protein
MTDLLRSVSVVVTKDSAEPRAFPIRGRHDAGGAICGDGDRQREALACALGDLA